jgi:hypothetical protein
VKKNLTNRWFALCWTAIALVFVFIFGAGSVIAQFATAHPNYLVNTILKGACGEAVSDVIFKSEGWTRLSIKPLNAAQGLDGVYVKRTLFGSISDVLFVESKAESSPLSYTQYGQQGSQSYIKGQLSRYDNEILSGLPTENPLLKEYAEVQQFCLKRGNYPSRIVRTGFADGKLSVTMSPVTSPRQEEALLGEPTLQETVDLANPKNSFQKKLANGFTRELNIGLEKSGLPPNRAEAIVKAVRTGQTSDWLPIATEVEELPVAKLGSVAEELHASRVVRLPTPPSEIGQYAKVAQKTGLNVTKTEVVSGLLLADGRVVMTASKVGAGAGLLTFAVDGGIATVKHLNGSLLDADYERELGYAAIKGTTVGTGVAVAVVLGATPAGWVVLAVGTGAYIITDFAVRCYEDKKTYSNLTIEDLKAFGIPVSNKPDFGIPASRSHNIFQ